MFRKELVPFDLVDFIQVKEPVTGRVATDSRVFPVQNRVFDSSFGQDVEVTHEGHHEGVGLYLGLTAAGKEVIFPQKALGPIPAPCQRTPGL